MHASYIHGFDKIKLFSNKNYSVAFFSHGFINHPPCFFLLSTLVPFFLYLCFNSRKFLLGFLLSIWPHSPDGLLFLAEAHHRSISSKTAHQALHRIAVPSIFFNLYGTNPSGATSGHARWDVRGCPHPSYKIPLPP
jgi:hypothetical protein